MRRIGWWLAVAVLLGACTQTAEQKTAGDGKIALAVTENGFEPATVTVQAGKPVTLVVTRQTAQTCATELIMASDGIKHDLPLGQPVEITFTPEKAGELTYACAMNMYKGKVVVK